MSGVNDALAYAGIGWRVLPLHNLEINGSWCSCGRSDCRRDSKQEKSVAKHPRIPEWQIQATTNENQIRAWWSRWPDANIGIATGSASGIVVLDIDIHRDKPGFASLAALETELGELPKTLTAATGSGGQHRIFKYPEGVIVRDSAGWRGAVGIDWRADGGQIVVAPSRALAGIYKWTDYSDVTSLPDTWIEALREHEAKRGTKRVVPTLTAVFNTTTSPREMAEDDAIISSLNAAGNADKFQALWKGSWAAAGYESQSNADLALCSVIAFWCDMDASSPDPDRIDRIFRRSALCRNKWERTDYRNKTIAMAVELEEERRKNAIALRNSMLNSMSAYKQNQMQPDVTAPKTKRLKITKLQRSMLEVANRNRVSKSNISLLSAVLIERLVNVTSISDENDSIYMKSFSVDNKIAIVAEALGQGLPTAITWNKIYNTLTILLRKTDPLIDKHKERILNIESAFERGRDRKKTRKAAIASEKVKCRIAAFAHLAKLNSER